MQVALLTIGDELLAGDTENTNATWLAKRLTDRGVSVRRILVVPDVEETIADRVRDYSDEFDAVIVTGGLGGTPDDVTMDAVARAFGLGLAENDRARGDVVETLERISEDYPDINLDVGAEASIPEGARPLLNEEGLSPGCVVENVFVLPGVPREMKVMFEQVVEHFDGDVISESFRTPMTESDLKPTLEEARDRFVAQVGCYPNQDGGYNRLKVTATSEADLAEAVDWLRERVEIGERE